MLILVHSTPFSHYLTEQEIAMLKKILTSVFCSILLFSTAKALTPAEVQAYRLAADKGNVSALYNLGMLHAEGKGLPQNYVEAAKWFRLAADKGDAAAQSNLGKLYEKGKGVRQDYAEAVKWYTRAADQGYAAAQYILGSLYAAGKGVRQDKSVAKEWYGKSCDNGIQEGCDKYRELKEKGL